MLTLEERAHTETVIHQQKDPMDGTRRLKVLKYLRQNIPGNIPRSSVRALEELPAKVLSNSLCRIRSASDYRGPAAKKLVSRESRALVQSFRPGAAFPRHSGLCADDIHSAQPVAFLYARRGYSDCRHLRHFGSRANSEICMAIRAKQRSGVAKHSLFHCQLTRQHL